MSSIRVVAYAKVNLSLEVLGKRPDGFHEVRTVLQSVSLADELLMQRAEGLSLECAPVDLGGEDNLVMRAARGLLRAAGLDRGARIGLRKGIPVAAGLGGASADAAAALVGLSHLWGLEGTGIDLQVLASELGSDVPFFLSGGTALGRGRGESIERLPDLVPGWLVLLVPAHSLAAKTAELYRRLGPECWSSGERTARLARAVCDGRTIGEDLLGNSFEIVADRVFPTLPSYRQAMVEAGAGRVHLSGAGPALFSLFDSEAAAGQVAGRLAQSGYRPLMARTLAAQDARPRPVQI